MVEDTLKTFVETTSLGQLIFDADGYAQLQWGTLSTLMLQKIENGLHVCVLRNYELPTEAVLKRALLLCHFREGYPYVLNASLIGDQQLAFSIKLFEPNVEFEQLQAAIELLDQVHDRLRSFMNR